MSNLGSKAWKVLLFVGTDRTASVRIEIVGELSVGRSDTGDGYIPDLDLSVYGGKDAGVSRRHAIIDAKDTSLQVRDLGSTNGTRINGFELTANQSYLLKQGDEIEFGHLRMTLHLVSPPG